MVKTLELDFDEETTGLSQENSITSNDKVLFRLPKHDTDAVFESVEQLYQKYHEQGMKNYNTLSDEEKITWMVIFCKTKTEDPVSKFNRHENIIYGGIKNAFKLFLEILK